MRLAAWVSALLLLAAPPICRADEVPDPMFWATADDYHGQVAEGQFLDRLELHLLQYSSDASWRLEWAAQQYRASGIFGEYGSTTTADLYVNSQIAVNLFPSRRVQLRYDRRDWQDGRFEVADQRFDIVWYVGSRWAVVLSGWPTFHKELASIGGGARLGAPRSRNALELRVMADRFAWNAKATGVRFSRKPLRILVDGHAEAGPWSARVSIDWGLPYEASEGATGRRIRGSQRSADLEGQYARAGWVAGARLTTILLERSQSEQAVGTRTLDRAWGRALLSLRKDLGPWSVSSLAAWASQRDDFPSPEDAAGAYAADALLVGVEGGWSATPTLQLRLGYLGTAQRAEREGAAGGPLPPMSRRGYLDKAHVRAVLTFTPTIAVDFLLSQAIQGGRFGGGSVKVLFVL